MSEAIDTGFWQEDGETPAVGLLATAVQVYTVMSGPHSRTVRHVADIFNTTSQKIAEAVEHHPWMLLVGDGPVEQMTIEHDGE